MRGGVATRGVAQRTTGCAIAHTVNDGGGQLSPHVSLEPGRELAYVVPSFQELVNRRKVGTNRKV